MKRKLGRIFGIILVITLVTTLVSCKEKHTREYIEINDEKIYCTGTVTFDKLPFEEKNENNTCFECKKFWEEIDDNNGYYRYYGIVNGNIYYRCPDAYIYSDYPIGFLCYYGGTDTAYLSQTIIHLVTHKVDGKDCFHNIFENINWTLTVDDGIPTINYNGADFVETCINKYCDHFDQETLSELEQIQNDYINLLLKCREEALNLEVKSEEYYVEVNIFDWYDPWGKILTIGSVCIVFVLMVCGCVFLLKRLPDKNE